MKFVSVEKLATFLTEIKKLLAGKSDTTHTHADYALKTDLTAHTGNAAIHTSAAEKATYALKTEVAALQKKQTITLGTLASASWSSSTYSFEATYPSASYDVEVSPNATATDAQLTAWSNAKIVGDYSKNVLTAKGTVPTTDIPIIIKAIPK